MFSVFSQTQEKLNSDADYIFELLHYILYTSEVWLRSHVM